MREIGAGPAATIVIASFLTVSGFGQGGTVYLTGRVATDDGSSLPARAALERNCSNGTRVEGYTDTKGYFSLHLGEERNGSVLPDAAYTGDATSSWRSAAADMASFSSSKSAMPALYGCELRVKLAGYRSQTVSLNERVPLDTPNVGTILVHREAQGEGSAISVASLSAPKQARKAFERGREDEKNRRPEEAIREYRRAVELYPRYATAWFALGRLEESQGHAEPAGECLKSAIAADPKFVDPYVNLARLALLARHWETAVEISDTATKLNAFDYPQVFLYNAVANFNLKRMGPAERSALAVRRLDTRRRFPQVLHLLGLILQAQQNYAGAAVHLRAYLENTPNGPDATAVRAQLTEVETLAKAAETKAAVQIP